MIGSWLKILATQDELFSVVEQLYFLCVSIFLCVLNFCPRFPKLPPNAKDWKLEIEAVILHGIRQLLTLGWIGFG